MNKPFALIIEDDDDLSAIFAEALRAADYDIEVIQDGTAALDRLSTSTPTVVILDLHLPNVSGEDILQKIRSEAHLSQTRVMLATADALLAASLRKNADLVLLKPISFSQMRDLAKRLQPSSFTG